jgi:secondary thiamine-phosphate synthase enzyme
MAMSETRADAARASHELVSVRTDEGRRFIDLTERVRECVRRSGVIHGLVNVQSLHTTAAVIVNEHEPLLFEDFEDLLERVAPRESRYRHDDFEIRTENLLPEERANGHAHARALLLGASQTFSVVEGAIVLGRWQRIFLVELDGARERSISIGVTGLGEAPCESG